jgi:hypothetical protein
MFASRRKAGFSTAGPVSRFVIAASQMSRPSYERPALSSASSPGAAAAHSSSVSVSSVYV